MTHTNRELHAIGETLRQEQPVLWAILRGRGGEARIAWLLGWSPKMVQDELADLKRRGQVTLSTQGTTWSIANGHPQADLYSDLRNLYYKLELKVAELYPASKPHGAVSKRTEDYLETASRAAKPARDRTLTAAQLRRLREIMQHMGDETFQTGDFSKAIGFRADHMIRGVLEQLAKKGYVQYIEGLGKGHWWQITAEGITAADGGAIVKPSGRPLAVQKATDEILDLLSKGPLTTRSIAEARGVSRSAIHKQMSRHLKAERVVMLPQPDGSSLWSLGKRG